MNNDYLLTYNYNGDKTFKWFESEQKLSKFVVMMRQTYSTFELIEAIHIIQDEQIEINN